MDAEKNLHILLVDDDARLQSSVRDYLEPYGFKVTSLADGNDIVEKLDSQQPDIVLLDVMMPGTDGFGVLQHIRADSRVPVIMLTARGDDADRIVGLELGADDYMPKPFNPRELLARIKAVLRRSEAQTREDADPGMLTVGPVTLDVKRQCLVHTSGSLPLSTTEFRIVQAFMSHAGDVLTRDDILTLAFGKDYYANDRNIDVYISRVRQTLRKLYGDVLFIQTVWGSGYRWIKDN